MHSDPIADLLTRIRNGSRAHLESVEIPHSKIKVEVLKILEAEGYIKGYEVSTATKFPTIRIFLKYRGKNQSVFSVMKRVSTPGLRVYKGVDELRPIKSGLATRILSTNRGLMTDREARKKRVGGEVICEVW
ncbi:MAG: 30S ribosomal protein S8 [Fimbriimonadaceae bacterium]|jgi:small subunit ribosomal protein S8